MKLKFKNVGMGVKAGKTKRKDSPAMSTKKIVIIYSWFFLNSIALSYGKQTANELALTRDGKPDATIVVSSNPTYSAYFAAQELREHVWKISGAELPIVSDEHPVQGIRILIGESKVTRELGLKSGDFKPQEYLVRFLPDTLVLIGRDKDEPPPAHPNSRRESQWVDGKFGKAMSFSNSMVTVSDFKFPDEIGSMEAWVRLAGPQTNATLLRLDGGKSWTYHSLGVAQRRITYNVGVEDGKKVSQVSSGELGEGWHHVLATHSLQNQKIELFVDGKSQGTGSYAVATACRDSSLKVGGLDQGTNRVNTFSGCIDEIRISKTLRKPEIPIVPCSLDADTVLLMHCDAWSIEQLREIKEPPYMFSEQGSCYAVHDFLERYCDVRWYGPTELEAVFPVKATLKVKGDEIRRQPAFIYREPYPSYMASGMRKELWNNPSQADLRLFFHRIRAGGTLFSCGHSFYGFYDRFWKKNPKCPEVFEGEHPEFFARNWPEGYKEKYGKHCSEESPPQMCYSNPDFIKQVVQDARDFFDGKGLKKGAPACGDIFGLEAMDNAFYCMCPACKAQYNLPENYGHETPPKGVAAYRYFSADFSSDYWFGFVNKVAEEIAKSHPGKYLATLAYGAHAAYPGFPLASNVVVGVCIGTRSWPAFPSEGRHELNVYKRWVEDSRKTGRPLFFWLYYCFPEEMGMMRGFNCFPGFFAHAAGRQIKMFAEDGIKGAFFCGLGEQVDTYVSFKLMDDPMLDVDDLLDDFFGSYYGAAGKPLKKLYLAIEDTYCNPDNYPAIVRQHPDWQFHQTEEMAWGYLGTEKRMAKFGKLIVEAKAKAQSDAEKQRVTLFEKGVWEHMVLGRKHYLDNNDPELMKQREAYRDKLKAEPPPSLPVPAVPGDAGGDPLKVDWIKAPVLAKWSTVTGYLSDSKITARLVHDQNYLYVQLEELTDPAKLVNGSQVFNGDDWEVFFSAQRGKGPYRQFAVNPSGEVVKLAYGEESKEWESAIKVVSNRSGKDKWIVSLAFPLETLLPGGVKSGRKFYANFYRGQPSGLQENLAWSPNFDSSFHKLDRLGEFVLE